MGGPAGWLGEKGFYGDRHHLDGPVSTYQERPEEFVPGVDRGQDSESGQGGTMDRQDNTKEDREVAGPVDQGGFLQFPGRRQKHLAEEEDREWRHQGVRRRHTLVSVQPAEIFDQDEVGDE